MSSLATIQTQFDAYDPATMEQTEIKAVLEVHINANPQYPGNECISGLREDLQPSLLYSRKAVSGATILHRLLRNYLQLKGLVYTQSTESTRITYGLITMLYESQSDCDTALTLLRNAQPSTSDAVSTGNAVNNDTQAYSSEPSTKISYSMATRFKAEKTFIGKLEEDLTDGKYKIDFYVQQLKPFISKDRHPHADLTQNEVSHAMLVNLMSEEAPRAPIYRAFNTEIIKPGDPRTEKFEEAKRAES
jgi:hypothetical protein